MEAIESRSIGDRSTDKSNERGAEDFGESLTKGKEFIESRRWDDLPADCLVCILEKLSLEDLALHAPFVCKSWYGATLDPTCWRTLDFRTIEPLPGNHFSENLKLAYQLDHYTFRGFLKFLIKRSNKSPAKLLVPGTRVGLLLDLVYLCQECPRIKIFISPLPEQDPRKSK